jgi:hypothetical protein
MGREVSLTSGIPSANDGSNNHAGIAMAGSAPLPLKPRHHPIVRLGTRAPPTVQADATPGLHVIHVQALPIDVGAGRVTVGNDDIDLSSLALPLLVGTGPDAMLDVFDEIARIQHAIAVVLHTLSALPRTSDVQGLEVRADRLLADTRTWRALPPSRDRRHWVMQAARSLHLSALRIGSHLPPSDHDRGAELTMASRCRWPGPT